MEIYQRMLRASKNSFFIFGARGTGKSTWVQESFKDALMVDLLDPTFEKSLSAYPERLIELVEKSQKSQIVIDEIQKIPQLLEVIHLLIEKHKGLQFILTGSSVRKLHRKGVNLLGGRASVRYMHPYLLSEIPEPFSLDKALDIGTIPLVVHSKDPCESLEGYVSLYVKPEIAAEGYVRSIEDFSRFLEVMSFSHGSTVNISSVAREAHVKRKTAENYMDITEELLIGFRLNVFTKRPKRELAAHPKFYFFDTGVYRFIKPKGFKESPEEVLGPALEGLVAQHLRAWCDYSKGRHQLYYWKTKDKKEVDFVVFGDSGIYAFEVKHSQVTRPCDVRALKLFQEDYPEAKCFLLYRGQTIKKNESITCVPVESFLKHLRPDEGLDFVQ